jgi:hypothetical protein
LRGRYDRAAALVGQPDDSLLECGHAFRRYFDAKIASRHHDSVCDIEERLQVVDGLGFFDFCYDGQTRAIVLSEASLERSDIIGGSHEGQSHEIDAERQAEGDVLAIFIRESR